jgi:hypothetical protein
LGELKNAGERGLFAALPHPAERRFFKALEQFFPGRAFRLFTEKGTMFRALEQAGFADEPVYDPAFFSGGGADTAKKNISLWRPFVEAEETVSILIPVLPWPLSPEVLVLEKNTEDLFPPSELVPPAVLAPATRALYDLAVAAKVSAANRSRYSKIEKALKSGAWRRRGIYLTKETVLNGETYKALFLEFLEAGFLIPPSQNEPLILPPSLSNGEETKLAELLGRE